MTIKPTSSVFRISAVLWVVWGLVHILAGVMTMKSVLTNDISVAVQGIADAVARETLIMNYPDAAGAVIGQHGFNLFWIGVVTFVSAVFIWKGSKQAVFLAAICGGLADLGYFLFLDLGGYVNFVPGTIMTLISGAAILLSMYGLFKRKNS